MKKHNENYLYCACSYMWLSKSKLLWVTCPNCHKKTINPYSVFTQDKNAGKCLGTINPKNVLSKHSPISKKIKGKITKSPNTHTKKGED